MKIPGADRVRIDQTKVHGYLLSPSHPVGRFKARVFAALGFTQATVDLFTQEIRRIGVTGDVQTVEDTEYGRKYTVPGDLQGPTGQARVLTVSFQEPGEPQVRLVPVRPRSR